MLLSVQESGATNELLDDLPNEGAQLIGAIDFQQVSERRDEQGCVLGLENLATDGIKNVKVVVQVNVRRGTFVQVA